VKGLSKGEIEGKEGEDFSEMVVKRGERRKERGKYCSERIVKRG
jgi:hypothetical protein